MGIKEDTGHHNMQTIKYVQGNLIDNMIPNTTTIQVVNNINRMGSGVAKAILDRFPIVKQCYHEWFESKNTLTDTYETTGSPELGQIQIVYIPGDIRVINAIAQNGVIGPNNPKPLDYDALEQCLTKIKSYVGPNNRIVCPLFGAKLAGGDWDRIQQITRLILKDFKITVFVLNEHDLPEKFRPLLLTS